MTQPEIDRQEVTAFAGGGKANATALSEVGGSGKIHRVICATDDDSVLLPPSNLQSEIIFNIGPGALAIYGKDSSLINGFSAATPFTLPAGHQREFHSVRPGAIGKWYADPVDDLGDINDRLDVMEASAPASPESASLFFDDFEDIWDGAGGVGLKWTPDTSMSGTIRSGAVRSALATAGYTPSNAYGLLLGKVALLTDGSSAYQGDGGDQYTIGTGEITWEQDFYLPDLSTAAEEYTLQAGLLDVFNTYAEGFKFRYSRTVSTFWQCLTEGSGGTTTTTTAVAVAPDVKVKLKIVVNAAGTSVGYFINGTLVATHTTNITAENVGAWFRMLKTAVTANAARYFISDTCRVRQTFAVAR